MSQANVEIAKKVVDAFNRRDVEGFFALAASDFDWYPAMAATVEGSGYRGRDGIEKFLVDIGDAWGEYRLVPNEFRDLGDRVLVLGRVEGRGRGSGVPVSTPWGVVYDFRDGKVSRAHAFFDHAEALRAAGLAD